VSRKPKIPPDEKITAVEAYLHGELGTTEAVQRYKISTATWRTWRMLYTTRGPEGLMPQSRNRKYSPTFKENVVKEYLEGKNSLLGLCKKYSISSHGMVQSWIKRYNGQKDFRKSGSETCMTKGRVTTLDERIEIISYCIENAKDYGKAVEKYHVSYQQIEDVPIAVEIEVAVPYPVMG
jgi:transposase-like protein